MIDMSQSFLDLPSTNVNDYLEVLLEAAKRKQIVIGDTANLFSLSNYINGNGETLALDAVNDLVSWIKANYQNFIIPIGAREDEYCVAFDPERQNWTYQSVEELFLVAGIQELGGKEVTKASRLTALADGFPSRFTVTMPDTSWSSNSFSSFVASWNEETNSYTGTGTWTSGELSGTTNFNICPSSPMDQNWELLGGADGDNGWIDGGLLFDGTNMSGNETLWSPDLGGVFEVFDGIWGTSVFGIEQPKEDAFWYATTFSDEYAGNMCYVETEVADNSEDTYTGDYVTIAMLENLRLAIRSLASLKMGYSWTNMRCSSIHHYMGVLWQSVRERQLLLGDTPWVMYSNTESLVSSYNQIVEWAYENCQRFTIPTAYQGVLENLDEETWKFQDMSDVLYLAEVNVDDLIGYDYTISNSLSFWADENMTENSPVLKKAQREDPSTIGGDVIPFDNIIALKKVLHILCIVEETPEQIADAMTVLSDNRGYIAVGEEYENESEAWDSMIAAANEAELLSDCDFIGEEVSLLVDLANGTYKYATKYNSAKISYCAAIITTPEGETVETSSNVYVGVSPPVSSGVAAANSPNLSPGDVVNQNFGSLNLMPDGRLILLPTVQKRTTKFDDMDNPPTTMPSAGDPRNAKVGMATVVEDTEPGSSVRIDKLNAEKTGFDSPPNHIPRSAALAMDWDSITSFYKKEYGVGRTGIPQAPVGTLAATYPEANKVFFRTGSYSLFTNDQNKQLHTPGEGEGEYYYDKSDRKFHKTIRVLKNLKSAFPSTYGSTVWTEEVLQPKSIEDYLEHVQPYSLDPQILAEPTPLFIYEQDSKIVERANQKLSFVEEYLQTVPNRDIAGTAGGIYVLPTWSTDSIVDEIVGIRGEVDLNGEQIEEINRRAAFREWQRACDFFPPPENLPYIP